MANWHYYDDDGNRITVTGKELKELAKEGLITPDTIVENEEGKTARAGRVKGLVFAEMLSIEEEDIETPVTNEKYCVALQPTLLGLPSIPSEANNYFTDPASTEPTTFTAEKQTGIDRFLSEHGKKYGNDVKMVDQYGWTLLHVAAQFDNVDVVKSLISKGAYINVKADSGRTPLDIAKEKGNTAVFQYLLSVDAVPGDSSSATFSPKQNKQTSEEGRVDNIGTTPSGVLFAFAGFHFFILWMAYPPYDFVSFATYLYFAILAISFFISGIFTAIGKIDSVIGLTFYGIAILGFLAFLVVGVSWLIILMIIQHFFFLLLLLCAILAIGAIIYVIRKFAVPTPQDASDSFGLKLRRNCIFIGCDLAVVGVFLYFLSGYFLNSINFSTQNIGSFMVLASIFLVPVGLILLIAGFVIPKK